LGASTSEVGAGACWFPPIRFQALPACSGHNQGPRLRYRCCCTQPQQTVPCRETSGAELRMARRPSTSMGARMRLVPARSRQALAVPPVLLLAAQPTGVSVLAGVKPVTQDGSRSRVPTQDRQACGTSTDQQASASSPGFGRWVNGLARVSVERSFPQHPGQVRAARSSWSAPWRSTACCKHLGIGQRGPPTGERVGAESIDWAYGLCLLRHS